MSAFVGLDVYSEKTFAIVLDWDGRVRVVAQRRMMNELVPSFLRLFSVVKVGFEGFDVCGSFVSGFGEGRLQGRGFSS